MPHGWKKEHKETAHPKSIQKFKSAHRIPIIFTFCISILFFLGFWGKASQFLFIFKILQEMN